MSSSTKPASSLNQAFEPLRGVRVLDLSRLLPGPYATAMLAELGAHVVKLESLGKGTDMARSLPPFIDGQGAMYALLNRGKASLGLDILQDEGRKTLLDILPSFDILVESFRPGVLARLGLAPDLLLLHNPKLLVISVTGYGQTGPYAHRGGHDLNYEAEGGHIGPMRNGRVPNPPISQPADLAGGSLMAALAALAGLLEVQRTGRGRHLDVAMTAGILPFQINNMAGLLDEETERKTGGMLHGDLCVYRLYATEDQRLMALASMEPKFWTSFCTAVGKPEWIPRQMEPFSETEGLGREMVALFASHDFDHWCRFAESHDCCLSPVRTPKEALTGEYARSLSLFSMNPQTGPVLRFAPLGQEAKPHDEAAPALGEHTQDVLLSAGLPQGRIDDLLRQGIALENQRGRSAS